MKVKKLDSKKWTVPVLKDLCTLLGLEKGGDKVRPHGIKSRLVERHRWFPVWHLTKIITVFCQKSRSGTQHPSSKPYHSGGCGSLCRRISLTVFSHLLCCPCDGAGRGGETHRWFPLLPERGSEQTAEGGEEARRRCKEGKEYRTKAQPRQQYIRHRFCVTVACSVCITLSRKHTHVHVMNAKSVCTF